MEKNKKTILVPWDFTEVADNALQHAVSFSKAFGNNIVLINIISSSKKEQETLEKLNKDAEDIFAKHGVKPEVMVKEGSIFSTIGDAAEELNARMVLMGTHGIKGMQKLTGSWALKVIASSKIPFIVVQGAPVKKQYETVVFPVDYRMENKEKLKWAYYLSIHYNVKIDMFMPHTTNEDLIKKMRANLLFAKKYLSEKEIDYKVSISNEKGSFSEQTLEYAQNTGADLILIMTTKDIRFTDYVFGANEQQIIANSAKIPVMCVNPRTDLMKVGGFA